MFWDPFLNRKFIPHSRKPIEITPGKVTKTKIELKRRFSPAQNWEGLTGVVTESDGETPSYRAHIFLFVPGAEQMNIGGFAAMAGSGNSDADGKFEIAVWHQGSRNLDALLGSSSLEPILVAHVPGRTGGVSIPLPEKDVPASIKLPAPISRTGVVTVNGQPTDDLPALVRVMARPVDGGPVADLLTKFKLPLTTSGFRFPSMSTSGAMRMQIVLISTFQNLVCPSD